MIALDDLAPDETVRFFRIGRAIVQRFDLVDTTGTLVTKRFQGDGVTLWLNRHSRDQHSFVVNQHFIERRRDGSWWRCERGTVSAQERALLDAIWQEVNGPPPSRS